jgi:serine/threonine protein kinase
MQDPLIGQQIDTYQIRALLGRGGMAQVYRAYDAQLSREVALKLLSAHIQQQPAVHERFLQEGRVLASFQHPGIVPIFNIGDYQGMPYLVQELLPGPTLEEEIRAVQAQGQTLPPATVVAVMSAVASALDYAHQRGIIHRDLKPSNLMRNSHGQMVLMDFGIAKAIAGSEKLTQTGSVLGTPQYLAPEQARGGSLTHAVDIYALGVILYELVTGQVPFDDPSALSVAIAHLSTPPPAPRTLRPDVPPAVEAVILRALAKEPADRYPSAGALAQAFQIAWQTPAGAIHQQPTTVTPVTPTARNAARQQAGVHNAATTIDPALMAQAQQARSALPPPPAAVTPLPSAPPPAAPRAAAPSATPPIPAAPPPHALNPASVSPVVRGRPRRRGQTARRGIMLAGLAVALLGAFVVLRPRGGTADVTPIPTGGGAAARPTLTAAVATHLPTDAALSQPTDAPIIIPPDDTVPTNPPVANPTSAPATGSPAEQFRTVLAAAVANGQVTQKTAENLAENLDKLTDTDDEDRDASKTVRELERTLDQAERKGDIDPGVASELRALLDQIAANEED